MLGEESDEMAEVTELASNPAARVIDASSGRRPDGPPLPTPADPHTFDARDQDQWLVLDVGYLAAVDYVAAAFGLEQGSSPTALSFDASTDGLH